VSNAPAAMNVEQMRDARTAAVTASSPFFPIRRPLIVLRLSSLSCVEHYCPSLVLAVSAIPNLQDGTSRIN
jgi:hypothetical protein